MHSVHRKRTMSTTTTTTTARWLDAPRQNRQRKRNEREARGVAKRRWRLQSVGWWGLVVAGAYGRDAAYPSLLSRRQAVATRASSLLLVLRTSRDSRVSHSVTSLVRVRPPVRSSKSIASIMTTNVMFRVIIGDSSLCARASSLLS